MQVFIGGSHRTSQKSFNLFVLYLLRMRNSYGLKACQEAFERLKSLLTTAPIMRPPNWSLPFELMCDAIDYIVRVVLGQRENGKPYVVYYASKTLNDA